MLYSAPGDKDASFVFVIGLGGAKDGRRNRIVLKRSVFAIHWLYGLCCSQCSQVYVTVLPYAKLVLILLLDFCAVDM